MNKIHVTHDMIEEWRGRFAVELWLLHFGYLKRAKNPDAVHEEWEQEIHVIIETLDDKSIINFIQHGVRPETCAYEALM